MSTTSTTTREPEETVAEACYVYGIVPADVDVAALESNMGMGHGVELVTVGQVGALVESVDPDQPLGRRRDLLAHSTVLNEVSDNHPVLPMRFGAVMDSRSSVETELLRPQEQRFRSLLDEVSGKHQFNIRARYVLDTVLAEVVEAEPEIAALREATAGQPEEATHFERMRLGELVARAVDVRRERDAGVVLERLAAVAHGYVVKDVTGMDSVAELSFVVTDDQRHRFEAEAEALAEELDGRVRLSMVGPMALFDFVPEG